MSLPDLKAIASVSRTSRVARVLSLLALLGLTSGCTVDAPGPMASASFGPTVAFESVDGPPPQVFDRLVRALETESGGRSFSIVSREAPAAYRIRSYLSAQVRRGKTTIAWVWDIYDRDQQRALRLRGEETGGKAGRDAWGAADDQIMRRIAQAGLNGVSSLTNGTASPQDVSPQPEPMRTGPAVAVNDETPAQTGSMAFNTR